LVVRVAVSLAAAGVTRTARIATMVGAGPEQASVFLGVSAGAVSAPLNPQLSRHELEFFLDDLSPAALVVAEGLDTPARDVAARLRIPVVELGVDSSRSAGWFDLDLASVSGAHDAVAHTPSRPDDAALMLHTSGTTGRPKIVCLSHANLVASAANVATALRLGPDDRCLNVMPLFHIHGIVAALLASLHAGGSVYCAPGFRRDEVVEWIDDAKPTWYTAVPTIHQAMLEAARRRAGLAGDEWPFRFIRSSSAALAPSVMRDLEACFGAPVVEAYGMTEAAHQIATNPLPPGDRKPGSVGRAAGPEVAIMDDDGRLLPQGERGEIVIRGPNVTAGYLDAPEANAAAFEAGWFRTGDLGSIDADGYVTIGGRKKEIINRGGEKIAPREIDEALLQHPDVEQAVAFAIPHASLGEEVAAAVVLKPDARASTGELRAAVGARLSAFKVPRQIIVLDELPVGATGKLQRIGLAARLGIDGVAGATPIGAPNFVAPRTEAETQLLEIVQDVLGLDTPPSVTDDIFDLGADSLHVVALVDAVQHGMEASLSEHALLENATIEHIAASLQREEISTDARIVPIQPDGQAPALFCLVRTGSLLVLRHLAAALGPDQPVYAISLPAMHTTWHRNREIEPLARTAVTVMRERQLDGPYRLLGHSLGGLIAYEMANQLLRAGEEVDIVIIADALHPDLVRHRFWKRIHPRKLASILKRNGLMGLLRSLPWPIGSWTRPRQHLPGTTVIRDTPASNRRERHYRPPPITGPDRTTRSREPRVVVVRCAVSSHPDWLGWTPLVTSRWDLQRVPGTHDTMLGEPHVHVMGAALRDSLESLR
jgi:acyl-CoA synthetase (AMP-forming)/AMP-acid ligase II/thioesterase domain-containing protein/acyl carrier protein